MYNQTPLWLKGHLVIAGILIIVALILHLVQGCEKQPTHSPPPISELECIAFMSKYDDFGPRDIGSGYDALAFCKRFGYNSYKNIKYNTQGDNRGYVYYLECCK